MDTAKIVADVTAAITSGQLNLKQPRDVLLVLLHILNTDFKAPLTTVLDTVIDRSSLPADVKAAMHAFADTQAWDLLAGLEKGDTAAEVAAVTQVTAGCLSVLCSHFRPAPAPAPAGATTTPNPLPQGQNAGGAVPPPAS